MNVSSQECVARGTVLISTEGWRRYEQTDKRTHQINCIALPSRYFYEQSAALLGGVLTDS